MSNSSTDITDVDDISDLREKSRKKNNDDVNVGQATSSSSSALYKLISSCKREKGDDFTHTSFLRPRCAFYVPAPFRQEFQDTYRDAFRKGEDLYITERHRIIGPVLIDLDFRFEQPTSAESQCPQNHVYSSSHVKTLTECISRVVSHFVASPSQFEVLVLEKTRPTKDNNTGLIRDGIHFVLPDVVTRPVVQYMMRERLLQNPVFCDTIKSLRPVNMLDDVVDKGVIEHANWMMYGSKKPGSEPYAVTSSFTFHARGQLLEPHPVLDISQSANYVDRLSIRNKFEESEIRSDIRSEVDDRQAQIDDKKKKKAVIQKVLTAEPNERCNKCDCIETVKKMVAILNPGRSENYNDWIRLGWCLRNIDHRLLDAWTEFSRKSPKYIEGECSSLWRTMRKVGLNVGTLCMWAKQDNPNAYRDIIRSDIFDLIHKSITGTHNDVARVVHHMYRYEYACSSIRNNTWYEFRNHRWVPCDSAHSLRIRLNTEVVREYINVCTYHNTSALREDVDDGEQTMHAEKSSKLSRIAMQLKMRPFKENVMRECCELFYQEKFEELLDSNPGLLGFTNGVYDLDNMEFREGRPDDYVSFCTGIDFVPYDKNNEYVKEIEYFWRQVHPNDNVRKYVLTLLASFLSGHTKEERFHIWTGTGSNGKSKVIDLFELALGEYCCKLPVSLLTAKRAASNAASSEVARAKGKRFACLQEPSEDEKLNVGLMKELSGGDTIVTRALFKEPIQFKPMFKMVLPCNHLPNVPSDDGGTWRRIRLVEFQSKFVQNPTKENEFPIDVNISQKFPQWAPHFMCMLLEMFKQTSSEPIFEPAEVLTCTRDYQKNNDYFADFVDTCIERVDDSSACLPMNDIFQEFKDWVTHDNIPIRVPKRREVQNYMVKHMGKAVGPPANPLFRGFRIRDRYSMPDEDDMMEQ